MFSLVLIKSLHFLNQIQGFFQKSRCSTWNMKLSIIFLITSSLFLVACDKPNPHPETLDPIFSEFEKEADLAGKAAVAAEKELEGFQKDLEAVAPQTGQIKYAQKRIYETQARIDKLRQLAQYWKIRVETRKEWAQKSYLAAYKEKRLWPDPKEYEEYKQLRKLEQSSRQWNPKARLEQAKMSGSAIQGKAPNEHSDTPSPAEGGGGH
jgi:hypothetical protein